MNKPPQTGIYVEQRVAAIQYAIQVKSVLKYGYVYLIKTKYTVQGECKCESVEYRS